MQQPFDGKGPDPVNDKMVLPANLIPGYRTSVALHRGTEKNILIRTWGGLGDQLCAEPTLRFALETFPGCDVSLASEQPSLFEHLKFKRVFDLKTEQPLWDKYLLFDTIVPPTHLTWQFMSHMLTHCVDFPSLCAFRCQLPLRYRAVRMPTTWDEVPDGIRAEVEQLDGPQIAVHAGRHWPSKTFPADWWNHVLLSLRREGVTPILIGADTDDNRGTVDVDAGGCLDLRNRLTIRQSAALLHRVQAVITNDSSPLHLAAPGSAWVSYVATVKHPDYIAHWRNVDGEPVWSHRMKNYGLGGIWDLYSNVPNNSEEITCEHVDPEQLVRWLPPPKHLVDDTLRNISPEAVWLRDTPELRTAIERAKREPARIIETRHNVDI